MATPSSFSDAADAAALRRAPCASAMLDAHAAVLMNMFVELFYAINSQAVTFSLRPFHVMFRFSSLLPSIFTLLLLLLPYYAIIICCSLLFSPLLLLMMMHAISPLRRFDYYFIRCFFFAIFSCYAIFSMLPLR